MILFTLCCARGHQFEGWFRDGEGFETQQNRRDILSRMRRSQGRKGGDGAAARQTASPISSAGAWFGGDRRP